MAALTYEEMAAQDGETPDPHLQATATARRYNFKTMRELGDALKRDPTLASQSVSVEERPPISAVGLSAAPSSFTPASKQKGPVAAVADFTATPNVAGQRDVRMAASSLSVGAQQEPTRQTRSADVVAGKRRLTLDDLEALDQEETTTRALPPPAAETPDTTAVDPTTGLPLSAETVTDERFKPAAEAAAAAVTGVRRGMQSLVTGPIQFGLERVSPDMAAEFTNRLNEMEEQLEPLVRKHPVLAGSGEITGTVLGMMVGGGLLAGGSKALQAASWTPAVVNRLLGATSGLPDVVKGLGIGAAIGGTQFNPDEKSASRLEESVLGALFGTIGTYYGKYVGRVVRGIADRQQQAAVMRGLQEEAQRVGATTGAARDAFVQHYAEQEATKTAKYGARNRAGQEIEEGFSYDPMKERVEETMAASRKAGVPELVKSTASKVRDELGVTAQEMERAEADTAIKEYGKKYKSETDALARMGPEAQASARAQLNIPPPPEQFVPRGIRPEQYEAADKLLTRAISRARKDPAARTQLQMLKDGLRAEAEADARVGGLKYQEFLERSREADRFMRETIGPLRDMFNGRTARQLLVDPANPTKGLTAADFYDKIVQMVERGDPERLPLFAKALGPRGKEMMRDVLMHRAVTQAEKLGGDLDPKALADYFRKPKVENSVRELLGREGLAELQGFGKITARIAEQPTRRYGYLFGGSTWLGVIGLEHALRGDVLGGLTLAASGYGAHLLYEISHRFHGDAVVKGIARRASRMRPDSAELDQAVANIVERLRRTGVAVGTHIGAATVGGDRRYRDRRPSSQ